MRLIHFRGPGQIVAILTIAATPLAAQHWTQPVHAATDVQALIVQAEHNTNTVRTLVHTDENTFTTASGTLKMSATGSEDEVHNREQDHESVWITSRSGTGKAANLHYSIDIIFMNGLTYYHGSSQQIQWKSRKGMTFPDPYTGGWKRARTTVSLPKNLVFHEVGTSGGQTQVRAAISTAKTAGTVDLWISGGSTLYVVREDEQWHAIRGASGSARIQIRFGPFNSPLTIKAPSTQASA